MIRFLIISLLISLSLNSKNVLSEEVFLSKKEFLKIAFSDDTYGLVSDKSTHHTTLAGDQASGILSLSNLKPNKVCGFWICTNAEVLPRRVGTIFMGPDQEYQVNIVLKSDYIGDLEDQLVRSRDKQFWNEYKQITNTKNNN